MPECPDKLDKMKNKAKAVRLKAQQQAVDAGDMDRLAAARLGWCCRASACGRICERLVKGPGATNVVCVDLAADRVVLNLYDALREPSFACPAGWF